jgi:hypothetical protein
LHTAVCCFFLLNVCVCLTDFFLIIADFIFAFFIILLNPVLRLSITTSANTCSAMSAKETKSKSKSKKLADQWLRRPRLSQQHPEALKLVTTINDILKCNPQTCNNLGVGTGVFLTSLREDTKHDLKFVCSPASGGRFVGLQLVTILLHCSKAIPHALKSFLGRTRHSLSGVAGSSTAKRATLMQVSG